MRGKLFFAASAAVLAVGLFPSAANAGTTNQTSTVTATLDSGLSGTRILQSLGAVTLTNVGSTSQTSPTLTVSVAEVSAAGDAGGWTVTAQMTGQLPGASSCGATDANCNGSHPIIANSAMAINPSTPVVQTLAAGTDTPGSTGASLDQARTVWANSAQSAAAHYTSTHTDLPTFTLTPPNGTINDTYSGTLTVTLTQ